MARADSEASLSLSIPATPSTAEALAATATATATAAAAEAKAEAASAAGSARCHLYWFRKALRTHDNPSLLAARDAAVAAGVPLLCVFVLDPWCDR